MAESTASLLRAQWRNPAEVSSVLLIIGGDVVRMAFSQGAGTRFVPVCFSFGCVAYAFTGIVNILGDGRLLSPPDYNCKLINLDSGYARTSNNFVLSRILRDLEAMESRPNFKPRSKSSDRERGQADDSDDDYAIRITVYEALKNRRAATEFGMGFPHLVALVVSLLQICLSLVPWFLNGAHRWNVLFITLTGIFLVQCTGWVPQWTAEKLPNRQNSSQTFALTSGNGSREVMVIFGNGQCLDLEALASTQTPRNGRSWEKFPSLAYDPQKEKDGKYIRKAKLFPTTPFRGVPLGFVITQISFACLSVLWILLLINVSAPTVFPEGWCFIGVGALGMFQNAWLAAREISPRMRNMPLKRTGQIRAKKVMDGIMDFHMSFQLGVPLRNEFFPGDLREEEEEWWNGTMGPYDARRKQLGRTPYQAMPTPDT
ncbi:hypothetical protein F5X68DRAFT_260557 [Plectosphaerella plurivora]|uniref:Uncharacterized protein n=1 Tax=Plectosphaerella plurivora TaxID=936078 RepID=A0A9P8VE49_9PEZI|nr:hypothetical protein F5X68DRAFT_260557 [Plectosphaerella plurivora]